MRSDDGSTASTEGRINSLDFYEPSGDEPVLATGAFTHTGRVTAGMLGGILGLVGIFQGRRAASGLPARLLLSVTKEQIILSRANVRWEAGDPVARFRRSEISVTVRPARLGSIVMIVGRDGNTLNLQGINQGAQLVASILAHSNRSDM